MAFIVSIHPDVYEFAKKYTTTTDQDAGNQIIDKYYHKLPQEERDKKKNLLE